MRVLKDLRLSGCSVNIRFMTSQRIRALNRRYLKTDRATDVIAFPGGVGLFAREGAGKRHLGDIAISTDRAVSNARKYGTAFSEEVALYVIHGLLHLAGYRDKDPVERDRMREMEHELLQKTRTFV